MTLGALALGFALVLAIPLGVLAAMFPNTIIDRLALSLAVVGQALPSFFFALIMIIIFGVWLRWLPISGHASWLNFIMPSIALGYYATPAIMRLTRAGMLDVMASDYIRTARAKGLEPRVVLFKHALRNAIIPVVSLAAVQLGFMLGGSIVIETIFSLNGLGSLAWQSIQRSDFEVMQAIVLTIACFYILLTFLADMLNAFLIHGSGLPDKRTTMANVANSKELPSAEQILEPSPAQLLLRRIFGHAGMTFGGGVLLLIFLVALFAPALAPHDPYHQDLTKRFLDRYGT